MTKNTKAKEKSRRMSVSSAKNPQKDAEENAKKQPRPAARLLFCSFYVILIMVVSDSCPAYGGGESPNTGIGNDAAR